VDLGKGAQQLRAVPSLGTALVVTSLLDTSRLNFGTASVNKKWHFREREGDQGLAIRNWNVRGKADRVGTLKCFAALREVC
jgi:hypothetical protein